MSVSSYLNCKGESQVKEFSLHSNQSLITVWIWLLTSMWRSTDLCFSYLTLQGLRTWMDLLVQVQINANKDIHYISCVCKAKIAKHLSSSSDNNVLCYNNTLSQMLSYCICNFLTIIKVNHSIQIKGDNKKKLQKFSLACYNSNKLIIFFVIISPQVSQ